LGGRRSHFIGPSPTLHPAIYLFIYWHPRWPLGWGLPVMANSVSVVGESALPALEWVQVPWPHLNQLLSVQQWMEFHFHSFVAGWTNITWIEYLCDITLHLGNLHIDGWMDRWMDGWMEPHYDLVMVEPTPSNLVWLKSSFNLVSYSNLVTYLWKPSSHPPPTTYLSHHKINCKVLLFLSLLCYLLITSNKEGKGSNPRLKSSSTRGKGDWIIWGLY
jgi:hypothetical protein